MPNLQRQLSFVKGLLQKHGLLEAEKPATEAKQKTKEYTVVCSAKREGHALELWSFDDGAVLLGLTTLGEHQTGFMIIITPKSNGRWYVQVADDLLDYCSPFEIELWNALPQRENVDQGIFSRRNGARAVRTMIERFSKLPHHKAAA